MAQGRNQSETDGLGLPVRMWWLWPLLIGLMFIWCISLWAVRVADTTSVMGVVTSHRGLGSTARARLAVLIPSSVDARPLGESVRVNCDGSVLAGQVFSEAGETISVQDIRDLVGSRLMADRLFSQAVRLQQVVTELGDYIPALGEHCKLTIISQQIRLVRLLGRGVQL
ncbi:hypothetical protein N8Y93_02395 [Litorivicinus sp.]|nr:hypothetical protein [Litorivicinus sp.]